MTLPGSGIIYMSQVNTELQRSATAPLGLNDSGVRFLTGQSSGYVDMNSLHGKSYYVDTQTLYQGVYADKINTFYGYFNPYCGAISDGVFDPFGASIAGIYYSVAAGWMYFVLNGTLPNSGWSTMILEGLGSYSRGSTAFSQSGGQTIWAFGVANPFDGSSTTTVHFMP